MIRRPSHLVPPFEAVQIQKPMSVHSQPPTLPKFFVKYRMSRYLPKEHQEIVASSSHGLGHTIAYCHFHDALWGEVRGWGAWIFTNRDLLPATVASLPSLRYFWHISGLWLRHCQQFGHQGGFETDQPTQMVEEQKSSNYRVRPQADLGPGPWHDLRSNKYPYISTFTSKRCPDVAEAVVGAPLG